MVRFNRTMTTTTRRIESAGRRRARISAKWYDPFPEVHGTLPEKMVYAELSRLGVPFYFLGNVQISIPEIQLDKKFQADFQIPSLKLIIEVQGAYFHSMDKTIEADAYKFALYEAMGYKVLAWWDYDIVSRLEDLILAEPLLRGIISAKRLSTTELTPVDRTKVDTSKGIRTLNTKRRKPYKKFVGVSRRKLRKARK